MIIPLKKCRRQLNFAALKKGARAAEFEESIQWLTDAGLVHKISRVSAVRAPLKFYEDRNAFKLFMLDVGLMGAMADVPPGDILATDSVFTEYKGAFTEVYAHTQMTAIGMPVYCHSVESSRIELDFVIQIPDGVHPVEVKAGENVKSKSMKVFLEQHPELKGIRLSMKGYDNQLRLENIPLYAFAKYLEVRAKAFA